MPNQKKKPTYLEEINLSQDNLPWGKPAGLLENSDLFLGKYDKKDITAMLDEVGLIELIHNKGYDNLILTLSRSDDYTSRLYVNFDKFQNETRIIELIVREGLFRPNKVFIEKYDFSAGLSILMIEWLALQDPKASFSKNKPRLPHQIYPGLGGMRNIQKFLYMLGKTSYKDSIVDVPEHFHSAVIYSRLYSSLFSRLYSFFSPVDAGKVEAMTRDLTDRPLSDVSFAISNGCLIDAHTGQVELWKPTEQVYPIEGKLQEYVESREYRHLAEETKANCRYSIDWGRFDRLVAAGIKDAV